MQVTSKGQVAIPKEIRNRYRIDEHSDIDFVCEEDKIILVPKQGNDRRLEQVIGSADTGMSTEEIMNLTREYDE